MTAITHYLCIGCPLGCRLEVEAEEGTVVEVRGFSCKRGKEYAEREHTDPRRLVSTHGARRERYLGAVAGEDEYGDREAPRWRRVPRLADGPRRRARRRGRSDRRQYSRQRRRHRCDPRHAGGS